MKDKRKTVKFIVKLTLPLLLISTFFIGNVAALTTYSNWSNKIGSSYIGLSWQTKSSSSSKQMTIN